MKLGIKPTVDIVFKTIFGSEDRVELTASLVNAILARAGKRRAQSLSLLNPFRLGQHLDLKDAILDVSARDESGREFQLEIQVQAFATLPKRMLHNWARCFLANMGKGQDFAVLRPVVAIWILERDLFPDRSWFHSFSPRDAESSLELGEEELFLTIELGKWARESGAEDLEVVAQGPASGSAPEPGSRPEPRSEPRPGLLEDELGRWLYFLAEGQDLDPEALPSSLRGTAVQEAVEAMAVFTKSELARHNYWKRLELRMERASIEAEEREKGLAEGLIRGRAEGKAEGKAEGERAKAIEDARRFKASGVAIEIIADCTGLSRDEVEALG